MAALYVGQMCDSKWVTGPQAGLHRKASIIDSTCLGLMETRSITHRIEITPHLRRLDSLTESEARELYEAFYGIKFIATKWTALEWFSKHIEPASATVLKDLIGAPAVWLYLLSKGFDLFGLIEAGWAKEIETAEQYRALRMKEEGITEQDIYDTDPHR